MKNNIPNAPQPNEGKTRAQKEGTSWLKIVGIVLGVIVGIIVIVGVLMSVVLSNLSDAGKAADDARRQSDIHNLRIGLEMYVNDNGQYPQSLSDLEESGINNPFLENPDADAYYEQLENGNSYCAATCLEGDTAPANNDQQCAASFSFSCDGTIYAIQEEIPQQNN